MHIVSQPRQGLFQDLNLTFVARKKKSWFMKRQTYTQQFYLFILIANLAAPGKTEILIFAAIVEVAKDSLSISPRAPSDGENHH